MTIRTLAFLLFLTLGAAWAQTPIVGGVVNGASFGANQPVAPGSIISIFGTRLATSIAAADSVPLSTRLGGTTVRFTTSAGVIDAPLIYAQPDNGAASSQINLQVPREADNGFVTMVVIRDGVSSAAVQVPVAAIAPGIFTANGRAVATHANGTLAWPTGAAPGSSPAKTGETIILYATGLGAVTPAISNGANSLDRTRTLVTVPTVLIGGVNASVQFAGLAPQFVGLNQLNIVVPANSPLGDRVPIQIVSGGVTTPDSLTIAVTLP